MVKYTFHYFNGRGRAEISRLIFAAAGVEFDDHRIENWPKEKQNAPIGQVPYLEFDDMKLPQSLSVARYLAREYNLAGKNNLESAKADAVVDTCIDLMTGFYNKVFLVSDAKDKEVALKMFLTEDAARGLERIEALVKSYGEKGYSVGKHLTWADLFIHESTSQILTYGSEIIAKFPALQKVRELVESNDKVAKYLRTRPVTQY